MHFFFKVFDERFDAKVSMYAVS